MRERIFSTPTGAVCRSGRRRYLGVGALDRLPLPSRRRALAPPRPHPAHGEGGEGGGERGNCEDHGPRGWSERGAAVEEA